MTKLSKINRRIAVVLTKVVGSMGAAYIFATLAFISLPEAIHGGTGPLVAWIAQTFLQLVLLPIIMVGQNVTGKAAEDRAKADHHMIMQEFAMLRTIMDKLDA